MDVLLMRPTRIRGIAAAAGSARRDLTGGSTRRSRPRCRLGLADVSAVRFRTAARLMITADALRVETRTAAQDGVVLGQLSSGGSPSRMRWQSCLAGSLGLRQPVEDELAHCATCSMDCPQTTVGLAPHRPEAAVLVSTRNASAVIMRRAAVRNRTALTSAKPRRHRGRPSTCASAG